MKNAHLVGDVKHIVLVAETAHPRMIVLSSFGSAKKRELK